MKLAFRALQGKGPGELAWHPDGKQVVAGDADGQLQLFFTPGQHQQKRATARIDGGGGGVLALAVHPTGTALAVATRARTVSVYDLPALDLQEQLLRTTLCVLCAAYGPTGSFVACGCEDGSVEIVNALAAAAAASVPLRCRPPFAGPVLGVAFDPRNAFVAAVAADGCAAVFDTATGSRVAHFAGLFPRLGAGSAEALPKMRPAWKPDGSALALPAAKGAVSCVARGGDWEELFRLSGGHAEDAAACSVSWCKNGRYLASTSCAGDGVVLVWDCETRESFHRAKTASGAPLCAALWSPEQNVIALLDMQGQCGIWEDVVPKSMPAPDRPLPVSAATGSSSSSGGGAQQQKASSQTAAPAARPLAPGELFPDADVVAAAVDEEEEEEVEDNGDEEEEAARKSADATKPKKRIPKRKIAVAPETPLQPPFQPASSTMEKQRRFLAYNNVGYIVTREQGPNEAVVTVDFADQSKHKRRVVVDHHGCSLGSLSDAGFVIASSSTVVFYAHGASDGAPACDWSRQLPEGESALGVAVNDVAVCVVTSRRFLRIFSLTGAQGAMLSVPGPHLCVAARGSSFVEAYHASRGAVACMAFEVLPDTSCATVALLGSSSATPLPLSPDTTLSWLGFSETGIIVAVDSAGLLSMLLANGLWMPMLDFLQLRKTLGESRWVVEVSAREVLCVTLFNGDICPPATPPLMLDAVSLTPPLIVESTPQETALNVQIVRDRALLAHRVAAGLPVDEATEQAQLDVAVIRLVQALLRGPTDSQREPRILNLCRTLALRRSIEIAAKSISVAGLARLAEIVIGLADANGDEAAMASSKRPLLPVAGASAPAAKRPKS